MGFHFFFIFLYIFKNAWRILGVKKSCDNFATAKISYVFPQMRMAAGASCIPVQRRMIP